MTALSAVQCIFWNTAKSTRFCIVVSQHCDEVSLAYFWIF